MKMTQHTPVPVPQPDPTVTIEMSLQEFSVLRALMTWNVSVPAALRHVVGVGGDTVKGSKPFADIVHDLMCLFIESAKRISTPGVSPYAPLDQGPTQPVLSRMPRVGDIVVKDKGLGSEVRGVVAGGVVAVLIEKHYGFGRFTVVSGDGSYSYFDASAASLGGWRVLDLGGK